MGQEEQHSPKPLTLATHDEDKPAPNNRSHRLCEEKLSDDIHYNVLTISKTRKQSSGCSPNWLGGILSGSNAQRLATPPPKASQKEEIASRSSV
ncbi:hypothetical protein A9K55_006857 [Cordyceps militaris]|uniref:Uncharacterized protein n=1 Tax=Cordyceps militaris TaxID=73501 RepID=A0A2H4SCN3_CORMI|nr:hypothetical protein A9K55_006857 [Cordyceps militaris]